MNTQRMVSGYLENRVEGIDQLYLNHSDLQKALKSINIYPESIGKSREGRSIYCLKLGDGPIKVMLWSQMHGNETTGTRAMLDFINIYQKDSFDIQKSLKNLTIYCIPMLNPDGAERHTREDSVGVDLNRDFKTRTSPEIQLLINKVTDVNPQYLFNLHDQRSIFSSGKGGNSAVLSFLAPSFNAERTENSVRHKTMEIIGKMALSLTELLPNQIGRYTDEFYPSATGDNFTHLGYPCVLIESGFCPPDYQRDNSRLYTYTAILHGLKYINDTFAHNALNKDLIAAYHKIPLNHKGFYDVIIRNCVDEEGICFDLGLQYQFRKGDGDELIQQLVYKERNESIERQGHREIVYNCNYTCKLDNSFQIDKPASLWLNDEQIIKAGILMI